MGKLDILAKEYMRRPSVFADVFNQFLYHGKQIINPEKLVEIDSTEIAVPYGSDRAPVPEQRYRDVSKMLMQERFKTVERDAVEIMNAATHSNMKIDEGKESVDVCIALQEIREEGKLEGKLEGTILFAQKLGIQQEEVKKFIMEEYDKTEEEAEELITLYWHS